MIFFLFLFHYEYLQTQFYWADHATILTYLIKLFVQEVNHVPVQRTGITEKEKCKCRATFPGIARKLMDAWRME
jgi:hypothetical protein